MNSLLQPLHLSQLALLARDAICQRLQFGAPPSVHAVAEAPLTQSLGLFVQIRNAEGEIRGSVGTTEPREPLIDLVPKMACAAAFGDPRTVPLREEELPGISWEVLVLHKPHRIRTANELRRGEESVRIRRGIFSAVLLSQTARERDWDAETFLVYACRQAGLPGHAWEDPTTTVEAFLTQEHTTPSPSWRKEQAPL